MIQENESNVASGVREEFAGAASERAARSKQLAPIPVRVTAEERTAIKKAGNSQPLECYCQLLLPRTAIRGCSIFTTCTQNID